MARKIFISYKHQDKDVKFMLGKLQGTRPGDYARYLRDYTFYQDQVVEEEQGDEDLSGYSEAYIQQRLRAKLQGVSLLLILITPWMQELHRATWDQWIPRELNYALGGDGGTRMDIVGIVLPDKSGSDRFYQWQLQRGQLFPILAANIQNGNIHVADWDSFKHYPKMALYGAELRRTNSLRVALRQDVAEMAL